MYKIIRVYKIDNRSLRTEVFILHMFPLSSLMSILRPGYHASQAAVYFVEYVKYSFCRGDLFIKYQVMSGIWIERLSHVVFSMICKLNGIA